ncbi:hypothetical protein F2P81_008682 [Scophthalmus maximus]|uniref:Ras-related GTP-binding protein n=1 Tax=Scophthalmus maximus TaxID=52904 RepID=A0A6A4T1K8_SCOMX|nr:hypothetical protein F2P81_008682 [Scophthalmus maximus]
MLKLPRTVSPQRSLDTVAMAMRRHEIDEHLFNLKFAAKNLERNAKKCDKEEKTEKNKVKKGNMEVARIHAENAIRQKNQSVNYLRMSARVDAVAARVQTALTMNQVTKSMAGVVKGMDMTLKSMNLEKISALMDKFEHQFETLDVQTAQMEDTMSSTTTLTTPQNQVDSLLHEMADEAGLDLNMELPQGQTGSVGTSVASAEQVLLMGKSGSGKTSMRSIIFANYIARDTRRLGATIDVEHSHVRFLGNLVLNLWDCGGQDTFMENYFTSQRDNIFRNVEVLIYVFDVESRELEKDMHYYQSCLEAILQNSPDAKVFCLVHKMDLVQEDQRDLIFKEREEDLKRLSRPLACTCFRTSIWDETLYKAWSSIVYQLIPNVQQLETNLRNFAQIIEADEVLLFERATFLVISHYQCKEQRDAHRFEKISNIIKQFKLSCSKLAASFQSMEVRNSNFAAFIDVFTSNTYVMVIMSDPSIPSAATLINIRNARKHFEKLERVDGPKHSLHMRMR